MSGNISNEINKEYVDVTDVDYFFSNWINQLFSCPYIFRDNMHHKSKASTEQDNKTNNSLLIFSRILLWKVILYKNSSIVY